VSVSRSVSDRVALVTGVSRRAGIGFGITRRLLADGFRVFGTGWSPHDAEMLWGEDPAVDEAVAELDGGERLAYGEVDLADPAGPQTLVDEVLGRFGTLDVVVANHARSSHEGLSDLRADELDRCWAVNARASLLLVKAFAERHDDRRPHGRVVLFTSGQHLAPMAGELAYAVSKGAIHQMTSSLADALADRGITVNCVNPGPVDTGWATGALKQQVASQFPAHRWGQPDDVARLIAWLVSAEASWITGQVIDSEGGYRRWTLLPERPDDAALQRHRYRPDEAQPDRRTERAPVELGPATTGSVVWGPEIAEVYDAVYAAKFEPSVLEPMIDLLVELARDGSALEFAVGTGGVALPLSARGISVSGIELSRHMVDQLQAKPGADAIPVVIGDMTTTRIPDKFRLVYLVANTIMNVTAQDDQVAVFANAAAHLEPGGCFVLEVIVPQLQGVARSERGRIFTFDPDHVGIETFDDLVRQIAWSHHWMEVDGRLVRHSAPYRYVWPSELDLMALLTGFRLRERWADWERAPFTSDSASQVVVFEKVR
jgi:3-oxoacyl-[acyl-carrier protein] reductase